MGGYNSSRWGGYLRKTAVSECSTLSVNDWPRDLLAARFAAGAPVYYGETRTARFVDELIDGLFERTSQRTGKTYARTLDSQRGQAVGVARTPCHFGGFRYWLVCPACARRCGKLYCPPYSKRYLCRLCHDLSYTTAQQAHDRDRHAVIGPLARNIDILARADAVRLKLEAAPPGTKKRARLMARYFQLLNGLTDVSDLLEAL